MERFNQICSSGAAQGTADLDTHGLQSDHPSQSRLSHPTPRRSASADISLSLADVTWAEFPDLEFTTEEWRQRERVGGGDDPKGRFRLSLNEDEEVDVKPRMV
jgi:hypothetical protein